MHRGIYPLVKFIHRAISALGDIALNGVGGFFCDKLHIRRVLALEGRKHPIGHVIVRVRLIADAEAYARKLIGPEPGDDAS